MNNKISKSFVFLRLYNFMLNVVDYFYLILWHVVSPWLKWNWVCFRIACETISELEFLKLNLKYTGNFPHIFWPLLVYYIVGIIEKFTGRRRP